LKRIGLLSDTHCHLPDRLFHHFEACDEIWHAGDIGSIETLEAIEKWKPVIAVFGNIDGQKVRSAVPEIQQFRCEGVDVLIKHIGGYPGRYDRSVQSLIQLHPPGLFISGHSHILKVMHDKKYNLLHINPGAAGNTGLHKVKTIVRFTIEGEDIHDLEVIELEKRH
jgi:uncharacterized protein